MKNSGEYSGKYLAFEMEVKIGQFLMCAGGDVSGVPLAFVGGSILSVLINDCF